MTVDEARAFLENDPDIRSGHLYAVSVLEEAAAFDGRHAVLDEIANCGIHLEQCALCGRWWIVPDGEVAARSCAACAVGAANDKDV